MKEFNSKIFKLDKICIRNHDFDNKGHSLRYICNNRCAECEKITNKALVKTEGGKKFLKKARDKYNSSENGIKINKIYGETHKKELKEANHINYENVVKNGCKNPEKTTDQYIKDLRSKGIIYIPAEEYKGCKFKILHLCPVCGNSWKISPNAMLKNSKCPNCYKKACSKREKKLDKILINYNIKFEKEKFYTDCRSSRGGYLYFDRYLPKYNILIEVDGEQHFRPVQFEGISLEKANKNFERQQTNDLTKNKYCKEHNIKLIRIRYDENIEEKLNRELKIYMTH
jgi:hypothetical protein